MIVTLTAALACLVIALIAGFAIKAMGKSKDELMVLRGSANTVDLFCVMLLSYTATQSCSLAAYYSHMGQRDTTFLNMSAMGLCIILYNIIFLWAAEATPGKMIFGLQVQTKELKRISLLNAILRNSFTIGLWAIFLLRVYTGYRPMDTPDSFWTYMTQVNIETLILMSVIAFVDYCFTFNPRRRALHDMIGGTIVTVREISLET